MNDSRFNPTIYAWLAASAVFALVFGAVWIASSPREIPRQGEPAADASTQTYDTFDRSYTARVPAEPPMPPAPVFNTPPAEPPTVVVTPVVPQAPEPKVVPKPAPKARKVTPRDMFPVGDITRDLPKVAHPYRKIAELYPSFEYQGKLWSATGKYVLSHEADLVATGLRLTTGQHLFTLPDGDTSEPVVFVQSETDPDRFAVYRAS